MNCRLPTVYPNNSCGTKSPGFWPELAWLTPLSALLCLLLPLHSAWANLLSNAGFESGSGQEADNWQRFDQSEGRESWAARNGSAGFALYGWVNNGHGGIWQDVHGQTSGLWYAFSTYARAEDNFHADSVCLKLEWFDESDMKIHETEYEIGSHLSDTWQVFTHMAKSPPGTRMVRVVLAGSRFHPPTGVSGDKACMFDDTSLTVTNITEAIAELQDIFFSSDGHVTINWPTHRDRNDAVWRSLIPDVWQPAYSSNFIKTSHHISWLDIESFPESTMLYRIERGEELIPGSTDVWTADGATGVTYHRFLPSNYTPDGRHPLVIALDPNGAGDRMTSVLRPSAEKFGWIVIGCNTIANTDPDGLHGLRFLEILKDIRRRIPHDHSRTYLAGFSGGASRGNRYARYFWDEFAGLISYGGWIGHYDAFTVFPERYAVARLRGDEDGGAAAWEDTCASYYLNNGGSLRDWVYPGGHDTGPSEYTDYAMAWLDEDYQTNGMNHIRQDHTAVAPGMYHAMQKAWRTGNKHATATQAVSLIHQYPFSWEAQGARDILIDIFSDTSKSHAVVFDLTDPVASQQSWAFSSRALASDVFPLSQRRALYELSVSLNPSNAIACAQLSRRITAAKPVSDTDLIRATALAETAITVMPDYWYGWYALAWCHAEGGGYHTAIDKVQQARDRTGLHPLPASRNNLCDDAKAYFESQLP